MAIITDEKESGKNILDFDSLRPSEKTILKQVIEANKKALETGNYTDDSDDSGDFTSNGMKFRCIRDANGEEIGMQPIYTKQDLERQLTKWIEVFEKKFNEKVENFREPVIHYKTLTTHTSVGVSLGTTVKKLFTDTLKETVKETVKEIGKKINNILPDQLKINSHLVNKITREVIPFANKNKRANTFKSSEEVKIFNDAVIGIDTFENFRVSYNNKGTSIELKIDSLNKIPILLKKEHKFNKFYDFLLYCLTVNGYYKDGYLLIPYKEWLEYTGRSLSNRMVKEARKEIKEFWNILKKIEYTYIGKNKKGFGGIAFSSWDTKKYTDYAEYKIDTNFIDGIGTNFYTLPKKAGSLKHGAYDITNYIHWYAKTDCKESGKSFNCEFTTLYEHSGLPDYEMIKASNGNVSDRMLIPFDSLLQDIRTKLGGDYIEIEYIVPSKREEAPETWEEAQRCKIKTTLFKINYESIIDKRETFKKKTEATLKNKKERIAMSQRISHLEEKVIELQAE